ncbi:MAG: agmatine deiminase family protein [bacterium]|nr:agmatine deiminase family protein [bacterium]
MNNSSIRFPAEWEKHRATWLCWPHNEEDWPGKLLSAQWAFAEMVRHLSSSETVEIICDSENILHSAQEQISLHLGSLPKAPKDRLAHCRFHLLNTNRSWVRDSGPTAVWQKNELLWRWWNFNAWAKYDDYPLDQQIPGLVSQISGIALSRVTYPSSNKQLTLEGGAIEANGQGVIMVTEECLLSQVQERNPGLERKDYEELFASILGCPKTIWLEKGIVGDDTHGHIDDVARFTSAETIALAVEPDPSDENYHISRENLARLKGEKTLSGGNYNIIELPMPEPVYHGEERLPASYANFYIGNKVVLVPVFNDPNDRIALDLLARAFPDRLVTGIYSRDLILGRGSIHCLTQQEPAGQP